MSSVRQKAVFAVGSLAAAVVMLSALDDLMREYRGVCFAYSPTLLLCR